MKEQGIEEDNIWKKIDDIIIKTIISGEHAIY